MINPISKLRMLLHPIVIFVIAQISWALLMFVWIRWYISRNTEFDEVIERVGVAINPAMRTGHLVILVEGCVLMGILLIALYTVFVNFRRQVRLNRLQDSILSNVTHELKTPIASIRLYSETLQIRELSAAEQNHFLGRILKDLDRLQSLVDRILLSAQLHGSFRRRAMELVDLSAIIKSSWKNVVERVGTNRNFIIVGFDGADGGEEKIWIPGIPYELAILFDNLFDNAIKYTQSGGTIELRALLSANKVEISVTDDGVGIETRQLKNIFRKFYRAETATKRNVKGSGLGLSVAFAIVKAHKGILFAKSNGLDKGSSFHVIFKRDTTAR